MEGITTRNISKAGLCKNVSEQLRMVIISLAEPVNITGQYSRYRTKQFQGSNILTPT